MSIHSLFNPRGVAVIGSMGEGKLGYELLKQILDGGYKEVFAVNPRAQGVFNVPGFASVINIQQPVDLAVIASPASTVAQTLRECGEANIHAAVVISSGFGEVGNHAGEEELKQIARQYGIRMVGPNCAGIVSSNIRLYATLETRPPAGSMAFISQSGALGGAVLSWAEEQGVGISKFVSYGNRADLDEIDLLPYLAEDEETRVVALYIESLVDGRKFIDVAGEFCKKKPLVVIKSGRTRTGQRATLSHTGSLAGADAVYAAAFKSCGAIRVDSIEEMFDLCKGFASLPPVRGRKVAIVTNSGGPGILAADRGEVVGLQVAEPGPELHNWLANTLPPNCALGNPIDLTVQGTEAGYRDVLTAVLKEFDAALAINVATPYLDSVALARGVSDAAQVSGKPVAANFMAGRIVAESIDYLKSRGIPNYTTGERAISVLARMASYEAIKSIIRSLPDAPQPAGQPLIDPLLEPDAMAWLRQNGIPISEFRFAISTREAIAGCIELGFPAVMKVVSPQIIHKSDVGGVILDIGDETFARQAFERLQKIGEDKDFRGVVIYPQVQKAQEVLVGFSYDPQFGPVVVLGMGGIYTETLRDISLRIAPLEQNEAMAMIHDLKAYPILKGVRGQAACDLNGLADLLVSFSRLPFLYPEIAEVDLNPVFLFTDHLLVGDVRVIRKQK
jgi:acetyl coenzyme A synthetase (ADP forming)-like protein